MKEIKLATGTPKEMTELLLIFSDLYSLKNLIVGLRDAAPYSGVNLMLTKQYDWDFNETEVEEYSGFSSIYRLGKKHGK